MNAVDDQLRFDLFLNFHGSEMLTCGITTRDLMRQVVGELQRRCAQRRGGVRPAIFFADHAVHGNPTENTIAAILQLRGGGIGLCILTPRFFDYSRCLFELAALLVMYEPRCYGVRLLFLCLGCEEADIIQHVHAGMYVDALRGHSIQAFPVVEPIDRTVNRIANLVMDVWNACPHSSVADRAPSILGRTRDECMKYLVERGCEDMPLQQKEEAVAAYNLKWITAKTFPWGFDQVGSLQHLLRNLRTRFDTTTSSVDIGHEPDQQNTKH